MFVKYIIAYKVVSIDTNMLCFKAKIFDSIIANIEKANNPPTEEKGGCVCM